MNYKPRNLIKESNYVAFGDSHTYGMHNKEEDTFAYLLGAVNYGSIGVSTDYVARLVKKIIPNNNFEVAFFLWPDWTRFEIFQNGVYTQVLPKNEKFSYLYRDRDEDWLRQNRENKIVEIEQICKKYNVLHVWLYNEDITHIIEKQDRWPRVEGTNHFNHLWHKWVSELFKIKMSYRQYEQTR